MTEMSLIPHTSMVLTGKDNEAGKAYIWKYSRKTYFTEKNVVFYHITKQDCIIRIMNRKREFSS